MSETLKTILIIALYLVIGFPIIKEAIENIFHGEIFDENFLMCVATAGALAMKEYDEAIMVMVLYRIGEWLEDKAVDKSRNSISKLMDIMPDYANLEKDGQLTKVDPEAVAVGDIVVIMPGERVPVDGIVIEGNSRLDTAALTGEVVPKDIASGSEIYSGSINLNGMIKVRVTKPAVESTASRILQLVEEAADSKAKAENFITKFAKIYTPVVCLMAAIVALGVPLVTGGDWSEWIQKGLTFLIISCPCALVISIPLSFFGGIGGASRRGILIKGGNYLEALSKADTAVFDKTGTLTKGVLKVVAVHPHDYSEERLLELATLAESFSTHPIAYSLAEAYGKKVDKSRVTHADETPGKGIVSVVDGITVACGNRKMMDQLGIEYHDCHIFGTTVHVAADGKYLGHLVISDLIKEDAKPALESLKSLGIKKTVLISGDRPEMAESVAKELGINEYYGDQLPQDKVQLVADLKAGRGEKDPKVIFVGDGMNDAPVLAKADVGVAMGGMGTAAAVESADIVLMNDKVSDVAVAIKHAKKCMKVIYENIAFALGFKVVVLIATAFGYTAMWLAVFADVGVCMLCILNSLRTLRVK